jgi:hypothetical protein
MVLRRKTDNVERALGIGDLLTFETRLTDDFLGIPGPVVCRTCTGQGERPAVRQGVAALRPISRTISRSHMKSDYSSWLCASCVPDSRFRHSLGGTQVRLDHE